MLRICRHEIELEETAGGHSEQDCVVMKGTGGEYEEMSELKEQSEKEGQSSLNVEYEIADWGK